MTITSPLKDRKEASNEQQTRAEPAVESTIRIHADFLFATSVIAPGIILVWSVGGDDAVKATTDSKFYVYLPRMKSGSAKIRLNGYEWPLSERDGTFVPDVDAGDKRFFESFGCEEAEVATLDASPA